MLLSQYKPLAQKAYCAAIVLLLILSEVFSSNIQAALPTFSSLARLTLTGGAVALLGVKIFLLTDYEARWQPILAVLVLAYTAFATWYGDDVWFFLAALVGLGAKDIDIKAALRVYLAAAVAGLLVVQLLHFATPLMPYKWWNAPCTAWSARHRPAGRHTERKNQRPPRSSASGRRPGRSAASCGRGWNPRPSTP